jgi:uroporphyrinogen-III synthase
MSANSTLAGRGIVITRPAGQAAQLAALIEARGGRAILFPAMEILDVVDRGALDAIIDRLDTFDLAIFISPNAAAKGWEAVRARRTFPRELKIAAIGRGSARELRKVGAGPVVAPEDGADSESLLGLPELQAVAGKQIVIFRGAGGRELLRETLVERGASVEYAECYRRQRPHADTEALTLAWDAGDVHGVVVTSSEGLRNLHDMLGIAGCERLARTPLFVPHPRIAATARELHFDAIVTAPGDDGIAASLSEHFGAR